VRTVKWGAAVIALAVGFVLVVRFFPALLGASLTVSEIGGEQIQHVYPTPSYWPTSPYPMGGGGQPQAPAPTVTVLPCPPGMVATIAPWQGRVVPACTIPGGIPPNPGHGPWCAGASGFPAYPPIKQPDGSYDC
jgi:hypothetical protein